MIRRRGTTHPGRLDARFQLLDSDKGPGWAGTIGHLPGYRLTSGTRSPPIHAAGGRSSAADAPARAFIAVAALVFVASVAATIVGTAAMLPGHPMAMPDDGAMTMARWAGEARPAALPAFLGMWMVMMVAMMLPSLAPQLWRYRQLLVASGVQRPWPPTALAALAYFSVWGMCGWLVFAAAAAVTALRIHLPGLERGMPLASGALTTVAGLLQFTSWKKHHLACCQSAARQGVGRGIATAPAWRYGLRLGLHCSQCCAGLTAVLAVFGVMNTGVMLFVTAALTLERLAPLRARAAQGIGILLVGSGLVLAGRAISSGWL